MRVQILEGYYRPQRRSTKRGNMKLGTAAKQCKGKKGKAFRNCVAAKLRKHKKHRKHKR